MQTDDILGTALCDLIEDMDSIAQFAIPYSRLPRKLGRYADRFPRWADVARQTPESLLELPKLGVTAVEALIDTAGEAVRVTRYIGAAGPVGAEAAATRLIGQLSHYDRTILARRVWALQPEPLQVVADRLGVSATSVARNLPRALDRVRELLADPAHQEVAEQTAALRRAVGPCAPTAAVSVELCRLGVDPEGGIAEFLLHFAGPYARRHQWLETTQEPGGIRAVLSALNRVADRDHAPTTQTLLDALAAQGLAAGTAISFLQEHTDLRCFGDVWVHWPESGAGNKAEAMLRVLDSPVTVETLGRALQSAGTSVVSSLGNTLSVDDRFVRASRYTWGLRGWGLDEYNGVVSAIGQRIDAAGGAAPVAAIVADILAHYPDVAESSIRTYLSTLAFIVEKGMARRRTDADQWPPVAPLRTARGCYQHGPNEIRVVMTVDRDLLRGSGRHVPPPVAHAAGVDPGQREHFTGPGGELTLFWRLSSTTGASFGSLRSQAAAVAATEGDELVLALRTDTRSFDMTRIPCGEPPRARLAKMLGRSVSAGPLTELAEGLDCTPGDVVEVLSARGDHEVLNLLESDALARC